MPYKAEKIRLDCPFLDKRVKLLPCQREMVHYWYKNGESIRGIARMFSVDKRLIQFELFPERKNKNLSDRKDRGGSKVYYSKEKHRGAMKLHRKSKHERLKQI